MIHIKNIGLALLLLTMVRLVKKKYKYHFPKDGEVPAQVSNIAVESLPGGAKITYKVPSSANLLYVKAVYEWPAGTVKESRSSLYGDSLIIRGLGTTDELNVKVYSVSVGEVESEPTLVKIKPDTPPVITAFATLKMQEDFGGVYVNFKNLSKADLVISLLAKDSVGDWQPVDAYYTNSAQGEFIVRGQKSRPTDFGLFVRDRWNNKSDTLEVNLTPRYERQLAGLRVVNYPTDVKTFYSNYNFTRLFDNNLSDPSGLHHTAVGSGLPQWFTIDLGATTKLSRFKYWMRGIVANPTYYGFGNPERWEVWGTNNPDPDGGWTQWTKLMDCVATKPSGLPTGQYSNEDREVGAAGLDFTFPAEVPPVRYLRWRTNKNFGDVAYVHIMELTFWGE